MADANFIRDNTTNITDNSTAILGNAATIPDTATVAPDDAATILAPGVTPDPEWQLGLNIRFWSDAVIIPIGILGNLLSLIVVTRKQNRTLSCSVYMGALAVADTLTLIGQSGLWMIANILPSVWGMEKLGIMCTVCCYILFSSSFGGVMMILALLAERVIAVTFPLKAAVLLSPRRAVTIIIINSIITLAYHVPILYTTAVIDMNGKQCVRNVSEVNAYWAEIYYLSKLILNGVLPFVGILTMNLAILCVVRSAGRAKQKLSARSRTSKSDQDVAIVNDTRVTIRSNQDHIKSKREDQLTMMTVVISLTFLCLTIPRYAQHFAFISIDWQSSESMRKAYGWSGMMTQRLYILNSAVNFFLYFMAGSKFRTDLKELFQCKTSAG